MTPDELKKTLQSAIDDVMARTADMHEATALEAAVDVLDETITGYKMRLEELDEADE